MSNTIPSGAECARVWKHPSRFSLCAAYIRSTFTDTALYTLQAGLIKRSVPDGLLSSRAPSLCKQTPWGHPAGGRSEVAHALGSCRATLAVPNNTSHDTFYVTAVTLLRRQRDEALKNIQMSADTAYKLLMNHWTVEIIPHVGLAATECSLPGPPADAYDTASAPPQFITLVRKCTRCTGVLQWWDILKIEGWIKPL